MTSKVTIQDIARLAGVSKATVSRVLNHKPDVDPETRERICVSWTSMNTFPTLPPRGLLVDVLGLSGCWFLLLLGRLCPRSCLGSAREWSPVRMRSCSTA